VQTSSTDCAPFASTAHAQCSVIQSAHAMKHRIRSKSSLERPGIDSFKSYYYRRLLSFAGMSHTFPWDECRARVSHAGFTVGRVLNDAWVVLSRRRLRVVSSRTNIVNDAPSLPIFWCGICGFYPCPASGTRYCKWNKL
jgi:hypothetical protein